MIRRLMSSEYQQYGQHLMTLKGDDRRLRFGGSMDDSTIASYCNDLAMSDDIVFGYFDNDRLIGAIHLACGPEVVEVGISVDRQYRNQGIGTALFDYAYRHVHYFPGKRLFSHCLAENGWMVKTARSYQMDITRYGAEVQATYDVPNVRYG